MHGTVGGLNAGKVGGLDERALDGLNAGESEWTECRVR